MAIMTAAPPSVHFGNLLHRFFLRLSLLFSFDCNCLYSSFGTCRWRRVSSEGSSKAFCYGRTCGSSYHTFPLRSVTSQDAHSY
jgi:hypothetical protein